MRGVGWGGLVGSREKCGGSCGGGIDKKVACYFSLRALLFVR